jgi:hypothetical protein
MRYFAEAWGKLEVFFVNLGIRGGVVAHLQLDMRRHDEAKWDSIYLLRFKDCF